MPFWKYDDEAKRLGQTEGLGEWAKRPLEYKGDSNVQSSKGTVRNTKTFSERRKAAQESVPEAAQPYPPTSTEDNQASNPEQPDTNHDRPRNNISLCPRQDSEGSSSKPSFVPFSAKYKRKG